jgi:hypothetical protein
MATLIVRHCSITGKWEVYERYGYRETLIAVRDTRAAAAAVVAVMEMGARG